MRYLLFIKKFYESEELLLRSFLFTSPQNCCLIHSQLFSSSIATKQLAEDLQNSLIQSTKPPSVLVKSALQVSTGR